MITSMSSVEIEPDVSVFNWKLISLKDKEGKESLHVVGDESYGYARVSTAIVEQYPNYTVKTSSGRVYSLMGIAAERISRNADYVLGGYCRVNNLEVVG